MLKEAVDCIKSDSSFFKMPGKDLRSTENSSRMSNNAHEFRIADGVDAKKPPNAMLSNDVLLKNMEDFTKTDSFLKIASEPPVFNSTEDISSNAEALRMMAASFKEIVKIDSDVKINTTDITKAMGLEGNVRMTSGETEKKVPRSRKPDEPDLVGPIPQT